jgi:uncharacterized repeat protein (TIGR03806 family)
MKQRSCRRGRGFALALSLLAWPALGSQRVPNTSIQMPAAPPTFGFTSSNAFPTLNFTNPTVIVSAPGESSRLFIAEKSGRIAVITNLAVPTRTTFMDISSRVLKVADTAVYDEQGLLGMEFHPGFATNGYFYLFYTGNATSPAGTGRHDILSRFRLSSTNANQGDTNSETQFIVQYDQDDNHNGGCLRFGPDGYLYVGLGDEGGSYGSWGNSQKIDRDFFSAIMRIDVDRQPGNLAPNAHAALPSLTNYSVPNDNPFLGATNFNGLSVNATNVRSEFWAVGVRNPWRFTFDSETGEMILGHVGQDTLEWINLVTKGANFGWNFFEGAKQWTNSAQIPSGFTFTPPLIQYGHTNGRVCIIGGVVSHGLNVSQLYGAYIYGDYGSGEVFALRHVGTNVTVNSVLFSDPGAVIGTFGVDPSNGDVLYGSLRAGTNSQIKRLIYNSTTNGAPLPPTLANTGVFTNLSTLAVAPGIMPYDINVPFWSDGALKTRWFSVPNVNLMIGYNPTSNWTFPTGTVWIKHFDLELTNGVPSSRQRIETRLLVRNTNGVYGVTYRWGGSTTNATLVGEGGLDENFVIDDGGGVVRTQAWHYPGRTECLLCHTAAAGYALGFTTAQLNRNYDYGAGGQTNQLAALSQAGYFASGPANLHLLPAMVTATNTDVSLEYRVRSYLAANCSQCHQAGGSAPALWDGRISVPTQVAGLINGPLRDNLGDTNNVVIKPGSLANSILFTRISTAGSLRMPPLASTVLDTQAIALVAAWITNDLPSFQTFSDWQLAHFGTTNGPSADANADPDGDGGNNLLEYVTATDPNDSTSFWAIGLNYNGSSAQVTFPRLANRGFEVQSSTNILDPNSWVPLDLAGNEPFFPVSTRAGAVDDLLPTWTAKFYRVRVFTP